MHPSGGLSPVSVLQMMRHSKALVVLKQPLLPSPSQRCIVRNTTLEKRIDQILDEQTFFQYHIVGNTSKNVKFSIFYQIISFKATFLLIWCCIFLILFCWHFSVHQPTSSSPHSAGIDSSVTTSITKYPLIEMPAQYLASEILKTFKIPYWRIDGPYFRF